MGRLSSGGRLIASRRLAQVFAVQSFVHLGRSKHMALVAPHGALGHRKDSLRCRAEGRVLAMEHHHFHWENTLQMAIFNS